MDYTQQNIKSKLCGDRDETKSYERIQQTGPKEVQSQAWQGGRGDPLGSVED